SFRHSCGDQSFARRTRHSCDGRNPACAASTSDTRKCPCLANPGVTASRRLPPFTVPRLDPRLRGDDGSKLVFGRRNPQVNPRPPPASPGTPAPSRTRGARNVERATPPPPVGHGAQRIRAHPRNPWFIPTAAAIHLCVVFCVPCVVRSLSGCRRLSLSKKVGRPA